MLETRARHAELMDAPDLSPRPHQQALRGLRRVNRLSNTASRLWHAMLPYANSQSKLRVLDLGSGGGDVLCGLARRAQRAGIRFTGVGCDISETACEYARRLADESLPATLADNLEFRCIDCIHDALPSDFDVVFCSLFLHHLSESDARSLLERLRRASRQAVLVDDLLRSTTGYALAWVASRLLSRSKIVHVDGPLSVQAAFTMSELRDLANAAGMESATITPHWPCRCLLHWTHS